MPQNPMDFFLSPEQRLEAEKIERRRRIAEAMTAMSLQPSQAQRLPGQQMHPLEAAVPIAQAYSGERGLKEAESESAKLAREGREGIARELAGFQEAIEPLAPYADVGGELEGGEPASVMMPGRERTQQEKRSALTGLAARVPALQGPLMQQQMTEAFRQPKHTQVDAGDRILVQDESGNTVRVIPKGAAPAQDPEDVRLAKYRDSLAPDDPQREYFDQLLEKRATHRPPSQTTVTTNVSTEKKFGEVFAGKAAEGDIKLYESAQKAPEIAERANSIKQILASGKVITGAGASYRLSLGKALGLAGANDEETIRNTELLASKLAANTLDAIKDSGLGSGQGFTDKDREFLERAKGGTIALEAGTISDLADIAHRAAVKSAERWSQRARQIPRSAIQGTGISQEPIAVPPLFAPKRSTDVTPSGRTRQQILDQYIRGLKK